MKSFFKRQSEKVFSTTRMGFKEKISLVLPKLPIEVANLITLTVMFKYFTDIVGINSALVGAVFFVLSIWNAVNDPIIGILIDRMPYNEKRGKYLFISKWSIPIIGVTMMAILFVDQSWPKALIYTYLLVMYILYEVGMTAYSTAMTSYVFIRLRDTEERMENSVISTYLIYILSAIISMIPLILFIGNRPPELITFVLIVLITLNTLLFWFATKRLKDSQEYYAGEFTNSDAQLAKDIQRYTKDIVKSRGFWVVNGIKYLFHMSVTYYFTFFLYYMDNVIEATSLQATIIDLANGLILFLIIPFIPSIARKYGTKKAFTIIAIPAIIGFTGLYFVNSAFTVFIAFSLIVVTHGGQMTVNGPAVSLVIDEDWQKTGVRKVGYINALSSLVIKPANGIRALLFGAVLSYYGYDGNLLVQSERAIQGLRVASSIVPLIAMVLCIILIQFLPYDRETEDKIIARRIEMEEENQADIEKKKEEEVYNFE